MSEHKSAACLFLSLDCQGAEVFLLHFWTGVMKYVCFAIGEGSTSPKQVNTSVCLM